MIFFFHSNNTSDKNLLLFNVFNIIYLCLIVVKQNKHHTTLVTLCCVKSSYKNLTRKRLMKNCIPILKNYICLLICCKKHITILNYSFI